METSTLDTSDSSSQSESSVASSTSESDPSTESERSDLEGASLGGESSQCDRQSRPKWKHVWSSADNTGQSYADVKQSLPTHATHKNDQYDCTMQHALVGRYELAYTDHKMRTVITRCTSTRCRLSGVKCACRYKINLCQSSDYVTIVQEGEHTMLGTSGDSPRATRGLTDEAKELVHEILLQSPGIAPHVVFTHLSTALPGRAPLETQVQGYLKRWRAKNKNDSMEPVIDICASSMFELMENVDQSREKLLVFCDSRLEEGRRVPDLGDASDESPFRIGLTCFELLANYINVQQDPRCTTILHVDSTHNMVKMKYNVFILGISDSCGHFFPVVYYCASQRRAEDVAWCLAYLKRVTMQLFAVRFAPEFVMTDADKAQYKACADELPSTKILMCWFHVCQHAWKVSKRLPKAKREVIFRGLNDLHFCRTQSEFDTKKEHVIAEWTTLGRTCPRFRSKSTKLIRQWLNNSRFSNWQAFHTRPGYPTTNNPVEQYHRTLKLENSRHAMPIDMVHLLDRSRIGFLAKKATFSSITEASRRLKSHYNKIKRRGQLHATALLPVGSQSQLLVVVLHLPPSAEAQTAACVTDSVPLPAQSDPPPTTPRRVTIASRRSKKSNKKKKCEFVSDDVALPIKSAHTLRMQWEEMPANGWLVDATSRACQCRFHSKFNMCPHIIEATKLLELPCPGFKPPVPRFKSRDKRSQRKRGSQLPLQSIVSERSTSSNEGVTDYLVENMSSIEHAGTDYLGYSSVPVTTRCPRVPVLNGPVTQAIEAANVLSSTQSTHLHVPVRAHRSTLSAATHSDWVIRQMTRDSQGATGSFTRSTSRESCDHTKRRRC